MLDPARSGRGVVPTVGTEAQDVPRGLALGRRGARPESAELDPAHRLLPAFVEHEAGRADCPLSTDIGATPREPIQFGVLAASGVVFVSGAVIWLTAPRAGGAPATKAELRVRAAPQAVFFEGAF